MSKQKLKPGEITVALEEEEIIWIDRIRHTIFGLPWSFTKYSLTASKIIIESGFFNKREEEIRLYRIKDVSYTQTFLERIAKVGTLKIISSDASVPDVKLYHIKNAKVVKNILSQAIEVSRRENGVRASELVGGPVHHRHDGCENEHESLGPEIVPDINGNGIDDRIE